MKYLKWPRRPGLGLVFRMRTPPALIGKICPWTDQPFGNEIKRGLGTRNLQEARRKRDMLLGEIRRMETEGVEAGMFSFENAKSWGEDIRKYDNAGYDPRDPSSPVDPRELLSDLIETELELPKSKRTATDGQLKRARAVALKRADLETLLEPYLAHRGPGNALKVAPIAPGTVKDIRTTVGHLLTFMGGTVILADLSRADAMQFRNEYLPDLRSPRAPNGPSAKTINKHLTFLSGIWNWAIGEGHLPEDHINPWRDLPRRARLQQNQREMFSPDEVTKLLSGLSHGNQMGDICRLALLTGCRSDELATLLVEDVGDDHSGFRIRGGKTENAKRFVPLPECVQLLFANRLREKAKDGRVFPEWPVRPSSGKCSALPAAFTRYRRKVLGTASDGALVFHSFRHTWGTLAVRAGLSETAINQLGGWAGARKSRSTYDHGLTHKQLREEQEKVAAQLKAEGYLEAL